MSRPQRDQRCFAPLISAAGVAYVAAAVLIGAFFIASAYFAEAADSWSNEGRWLYGFLQTYALALAGGSFLLLVFAVLLRGLVGASRPDALLAWLGFGATLGVAVPWAFARVAYALEGVRFSAGLQTIKTILMFPLMGAMMYEVQPVWVQAAAGAATGGTLWLLRRALVRRRRA